MSPSKDAEARRSARNERRRQQTRTEILDAAREVVLRDGLSGLTLGAVADELGLTKPALYYYFDSKEKLVFELLLSEWLDHAAEVRVSVGQTDSGTDAVEQLMRTTFERYREQLGVYMLAFNLFRGPGLETLVGPGDLARVRPINAMLYDRAEHLLGAEQRAGKFPKRLNPRRFVFNAHMAVNGILTMKAMTESFGDPLIHKDNALIDDLCRTFRAAALCGDQLGDTK